VSGDGIEQSNEPPPFAKDIEEYKGYTFYANTSTRQQLNISQLTIQDLVSGTSKIFVTDNTTTREYTYIGDNAEYLLTFVNDTGTEYDGAYVLLGSAINRDETLYKFWFNTGTSTEPTVTGSISIEVDISGLSTAADIADKFEESLILGTRSFNVTGAGASRTVTSADNGLVSTASSSTVGGAFSVTDVKLGAGEDPAANEIFLPRVPAISENGPSVSQQIDRAARSLVNILNRDSLGLVNAFYLSGFSDVPGQLNIQQRDLTGAQFFIYANTLTTAEEFSPSLGFLPSNLNDLISSNEVRGNRIYYSKFQQPEAVPLLNFIDIGPRDFSIQRIVALRDSLFIFKEDGIYRLSGDVAPFSVAPFDFSLTLQAPDTAVVLNNQVHALTTQGVVQVTDTGINVISRDIENLLLSITGPQFATETASFGVTYETDRSYLLFTVTNAEDTVATQCFRYNSFTNTWVRWDLTKTCGLVNFRDDKLYLGAPDLDIIEQERKSLNRTDYADREFDQQIAPEGVSQDLLTLSSIVNIEVGDVLLQTQYLTLSQFNRLLRQLDKDPGVADSDYEVSLEAIPGVNLRNRVNNLALKLDADAEITANDFDASISKTLGFIATQSDFNIIIGKLNSDSSVFFDNYDESTGTVPVESVVLEILEDPNNTVRVNYNFPFIEGPIIQYKAINSNVIYAPQVLGNPTTHKQVREGTFLFEDNNFTTATVGYKSDLSPFIETINFNGSGIGDWGQFLWGGNNWGGISGAYPLRTLIPLQKQRCRFLQPQFRHKVAFEKFSLFGISLETREFSTRAYR